MSSRETILKKLRSVSAPFEAVQPITNRQVIQPMSDDLATWRETFVKQLQALSATVYEPADDSAALKQILEIIGEDKQVLAWDFDYIPLDGLDATLSQAGVEIADPHDGSIRVGITGVDAAFAATGSMVLCATPQKPRGASLLPYVHVAVIRTSQFYPHFEAWIADQSPETFRASANINIITGASRTADIGMELVLGAHGPAILYVILLN